MQIPRLDDDVPFFAYVNLLIMMVLFVSCANAAEEDSPRDVAMLNLTIGQVGVFDNIDDPLRYGIEYRARSFSSWKIIPAVGYARAENGASFLYADLRHDFWLTDRWVIIPSFGLGTFDDSQELDLGNKLEFRTGIELAYRFHGQFRIGVALFHLSNGGLSERNPGTEALVASLCIPLER